MSRAARRRKEGRARASTRATPARRPRRAGAEREARGEAGLQGRGGATALAALFAATGRREHASPMSEARSLCTAASRAAASPARLSRCRWSWRAGRRAGRSKFQARGARAGHSSPRRSSRARSLERSQSLLQCRSRTPPPWQQPARPSRRIPTAPPAPPRAETLGRPSRSSAAADAGSTGATTEVSLRRWRAAANAQNSRASPWRPLSRRFAVAKWPRRAECQRCRRLLTR